MDGRKRTVQIKFRVTEAERDLILEKMKLVPTRNMAAYLRKIAIDGYIIQIDHADIKAMTAEIQKIGVNVNQIARRVNATGNAYQEDIEEIKGVLAEIWRLQRLSLLKAAKAPREQRGVSLLIDIENSIKAAQSKGYEQWAKIHNLKQAAKTMNFLTEHKIEQYADLVSRIEEMAAESGQAADALKDAEKRLADMAVLIKNVSTYQKTKRSLKQK